MHPLGDLESVLLDHTQDKVAVVDETGTYRYVNAATDRILGWAPDELVGRNAFDLIHEDDVPGVRENFENVISSDGFAAGTVEYRHRTADGDYIWLESRCSNCTDTAVGGYVVSSRDVTDRVEAERQRDETATRLRELAAQSTDVLWMFSGDWTELLFVNEAYEDVYGGRVQDVLEEPTRFVETVHPDDRNAVTAAMDRLSSGESIDLEYRVDPSRNYQTWVWVQAVPVITDGEVSRIVGFSRDVTDRRRHERQLVVIDNVLRHNLRNDMNTILGYADEIAALATGDAQEYADVIQEVGTGLLETAEKQREINELFTGTTRLAALDVAETVERALETVEPSYPDATFEVDVPPSLVARAVPYLDVAIEELLENAAKHATVDDPRVEVRAREVDDEVRIEVLDEAPPIPESESRVLTGDLRMDQVTHSTGLGLWLAYWVVDMSDGSIEFATREPRGNVITIDLPRPVVEESGP